MGSTLKIVAKKAGVSIVTASRVFNGKETVKPAFRKKVFDAAKALNYTPNLLARGLARNNLKIVSVYMGELENPYFGSLASNLTKEFSSHGYELIICDSVGKTVELNRSVRWKLFQLVHASQSRCEHRICRWALRLVKEFQERCPRQDIVGSSTNNSGRKLAIRFIIKTSLSANFKSSQSATEPVGLRKSQRLQNVSF